MVIIAEKIQDEGIFNVENTPDGLHTKLVIDIGSCFLKYSLFACNDGIENLLVKLEIKDVAKVMTDGVLNYNLLNRDITRRVEEYSKIVNINEILLIPPKLSSNVHLSPRLEYVENKKDFTKQVKKEFTQNIQLENSIYDWVVTESNSKEDYKSLAIEAMDSDLIYNLSEILIKQKNIPYRITSPLLSYLGLYEDNKPHLVLDFGHNTVKILIVQKGSILIVRDYTQAGKFLTDSLVTKGEEVTLDHMVEKHNTTFEELPLTAEQMFDDLTKVINETITAYNKQYKEKIVDYIVVGGGASLEIEQEISEMTIGIPRSYPKLNLLNDDIIPRQARNYMMPSYSTYIYSLHQKSKDLFDLSAPKSGVLNLYLKKAIGFLNKNKGMMMANLLLLTVVLGTAMYSSKSIYEYNNEVVSSQTNYSSELQTLNSEYQALTTEYDRIISESYQDLPPDTGRMLMKLKSITPPNFNIKEINLEGSGEVGTIVVTSQSQVIVATFLTLLQDPYNGIFTEANTIDIKVEESLGEKIYITTIQVKGRKI